MRQKKASNTWRSGHNHFWISVSCHVSGWGQNQSKKKISRVILEMSTDSNNKICSGKVWNLPLRNLPAKKRIIRTWHGTTLLRIRFFPWRRQRVTRNWMWISSNPNNFKLTCYKWVFKTTEYLAFEQAFLGALAAGREKEGELATTSLEFGIPPPVPPWLPLDWTVRFPPISAKRKRARK